MPALKFEPEYAVEDRIAVLETNVKHIQADVSEIKIDVRRLNDKIDEVDKRLGDKIDEVDKRLGGKLDEVDRRLGGKLDALALSIEKALSELKVAHTRDRIWWFVQAGVLLAVMARAFKWI